MTVPTITYYTFISLVPCFYFSILEILIKEGGERKSAWIDDDICVDVNDLLDRINRSRCDQNRIDERHSNSIFVRFRLGKHINTKLLRKLHDISRLREDHDLDIELSLIQRQHAQRILQLLRDSLPS